MSQQIDPLDPGSLPTDPREAAMMLLGMTTGELRSIDDKVVSGRNSVGGIRTDLNKIVNEIRNIDVGQALQQPNQPAPVPSPVMPVPVLPMVQSQEINDDQLEFDFYKKLKPEDIEYQLRLIKSSIDNLETKVNIILEHIKKKDLVESNGIINQ